MYYNIIQQSSEWQVEELFTDTKTNRVLIDIKRPLTVTGAAAARTVSFSPDKSYKVQLNYGFFV